MDSFTEGFSFSFCNSEYHLSPTESVGMWSRLQSWVWLLMAAHVLCLKHTLMPERLDGLEFIRVSSKHRFWLLKQVIFPPLFGFLPEAFNISPFFLPFSVAFNHLSPDHQNSVSNDSVLSPGFSVTHRKGICQGLSSCLLVRGERGKPVLAEFRRITTSHPFGTGAQLRLSTG